MDMTSTSSTQTAANQTASNHPSFEKTARKDMNEAGLSGSSMDSTQLVIGEGLLSGLREPKVLGSIVAVVLGLTLAYSAWTSHQATRLKTGNDALFTAQKALSDQQVREARIVLGLPAEAAKAEPPTSADAQKKQTEEEKAAEAKKRQAEQQESKQISEQLEKTQFEKFDVDAKYAGPIQQLKKVAEEYGSIRPGFEARVALAGLYFDHGDLTQAVEQYGKATESAPSALDRGLAFNLLATVQESAGKGSEALAAYEKAVSTGDSAAQADALFGVARTALALGKPERARTALEQVKKQFAETPMATRAESLLADLPADKK